MIELAKLVYLNTTLSMNEKTFSFRFPCKSIYNVEIFTITTTLPYYRLVWWYSIVSV